MADSARFPHKQTKSTSKAGVSSGAPVVGLGFKSSTRLLLYVLDLDLDFREIDEARQVLEDIIGEDGLDVHLATQSYVRDRFDRGRGDKVPQPISTCLCSLCKDALERKTVTSVPIPVEPITTRPGIVYLLQSGEYYKIGMTSNLASRKAWFDIHLPHKTELIHTIPCNDALRLERHLHEHFKDKRLNGEWFSLSEADIAEVKWFVEVMGR